MGRKCETVCPSMPFNANHAFVHVVVIWAELPLKDGARA